MKTNWSLSAAMVCLLALPAGASAQQQAAMVTASGTGTLKVQPDLLRVSIILTGQGKDAKEAVTKLATERDAAKGKLAGLGAAADSVRVSDPVLGESKGESSAAEMQMQALAMAMGRGRGRGAPPTGVKVSSTLEAEWRLKATSPEDRLVESVELMAKLKAGFTRPMTPEEQELQEELRGVAMSRGMPQAVPGEPRFVFVRIVTEQERAKATADALAQAKATASRLAQSAGAKLGPIRTLSENASSAADGQDPNDMDIYYAQVMASRLQGAPAKTPDEATSTQPGPITYTAFVTAAFALE